MESCSQKNYRFAFYNYPRFSDGLPVMMTDWRPGDKQKVVSFCAELCAAAFAPAPLFAHPSFCSLVETGLIWFSRA